jgi:hypothetical protein
MIDPMEGFEIEVHFEQDLESYPELVGDRLTVRAPWGAEHDTYPPSTKDGFRLRCEDIRDHLKRAHEREQVRQVYGVRDNSVFPDPATPWIDPATWSGAIRLPRGPAVDLKAIQAEIDRMHWNMASRQYAIPNFTIDQATLDLFLGKGLGGGS